MWRHVTDLLYVELLIRSRVKSRNGSEGILLDYDVQRNPEVSDTDKVSRILQLTEFVSIHISASDEGTAAPFHCATATILSWR